jgi:hypothetical protein
LGVGFIHLTEKIELMEQAVGTVLIAVSKSRDRGKNNTGTERERERKRTIEGGQNS